VEAEASVLHAHFILALAFVLTFVLRLALALALTLTLFKVKDSREITTRYSTTVWTLVTGHRTA